MDQETLIQIAASGAAEKVMAFDASHGASVYTGTYVLFEDGARREGNPMGRLEQPPTDPYKCALRKQDYHYFVWERAKDAFVARKRQLVESAKVHLAETRGVGAAPMSADAAAAELEALKQVVVAASDAWNLAKAEVEHIPCRKD